MNGQNGCFDFDLPWATPIWTENVVVHENVVHENASKCLLIFIYSTMCHASASNMPVTAAICLHVESYLHIFYWFLTKCIWWYGSGYQATYATCVTYWSLCAIKMLLEWLVSLRPREVWNPLSVLGWVPPHWCSAWGATRSFVWDREEVFSMGKSECLKWPKQTTYTPLKPLPQQPA